MFEEDDVVAHGLLNDSNGQQKNGRRRYTLLRSIVLFGLGVAAYIHEVFFSHLDRPYILIAATAAMGLELVFRANGK